MKKGTIIFIMLMLILSLFGKETFPVKTDKFMSNLNTECRSGLNRENRIVPEWNWDVVPVQLHENYRDFFQTLNETPVTVIPEEFGGGLFIVYRVRNETGASEVFCSYIAADGNITTEGMGSVGYYCDSVIDEVTGEYFACWHGVALDGSSEPCCYMNYIEEPDPANPGGWQEIPQTVINNNMQPNFPQENDEFIWPLVKVGPSPEEIGGRRVYMLASNLTESYGTEALPCENVLLCYKDISPDSLELLRNREWQYSSIPLLDSLSTENPYWGKATKSFAILDNQVIVYGYIHYDNDNRNYRYFCCINDNYGMGAWQEYVSEIDYEIDEPEIFTYPAEHQILNTTHFNAVLADNNTKIMFPGALGITFDLGTGPGYYYPDWMMIYPKTFNFDLTTHEFEETDVYPPGANPNDNVPMLPWDLDEDGEIDEYDPQGNPIWFMDWPIYHYDPDMALHQNEYFMSVNAENNWLAYIWLDGTNAYLANEGIEGYESWLEKPEIAICVSVNGGMEWSEPIFMNANPESDNYVEELDGMIPCCVYPGDKIVDAGGGIGILHLFFMDDDIYGFDSNSNAPYQYASIGIDFGCLDSDKNELAPKAMKINNYPNPFNPQTTIEFEMSTAGNMKIDIYNLKGQKVETLINEQLSSGKHSVIWDAQNQPSGIYFYKAEKDGIVNTSKIILLK